MILFKTEGFSTVEEVNPDPANPWFSVIMGKDPLMGPRYCTFKTAEFGVDPLTEDLVGKKVRVLTLVEVVDES